MKIYNKTYFEIYAALVLSEIGLLDKKFNIEWIKDKPDIQVDDIGVEVTRDIPMEEAEQISYFNRLAGKTIREKNEELSRIDKKQKSKLWSSKSKDILELDINDITILQDAIKKKDNIVNCYTNNQNISLFIFSSVFMLDVYDRYELESHLNKVVHRFKTIYILGNEKLFLWNEKKLIQICLSHKLTYFKKKAHELNSRYFDIHGNRKSGVEQ